MRNKEPLKLDIESPILLSGDLRIQAAPGSKPVIAVSFKKAVNLFNAPFHSRIYLEGLRFQFAVAKPGQAGVFIDTLGQVELKRCALVAASADAQAVTLIKTGGRATKLEQCWIEGFDAPIDSGLFPRYQVALSGCMIVHPLANGPVTGSVVTAKALKSGDQESRTIIFDHCTIAGLELLKAKGFGEAGLDLHVQATQTVVDAPALLSWDGDFPGSLHFEGQGNLYRITGSGWVTQQPGGSEPIPGSPTSLETWKTGPIHENDSRASDFPFQNDAAALGHNPTDYTLLKVDPPKPGADPEQVGPAAKAP